MSIKTLSIDEFLGMAGQKLGTSDWVTLGQERINEFADCTEDHQFIHVDEEAAKNTPFGGTIAHGFLTLSLLSKMVEGNGVIPENVVMGLNYGFDKSGFFNRTPSRLETHLVYIHTQKAKKLISNAC